MTKDGFEWYAVRFICPNVEDKDELVDIQLKLMDFAEYEVEKMNRWYCSMYRTDHMEIPDIRMYFEVPEEEIPALILQINKMQSKDLLISDDSPVLPDKIDDRQINSAMIGSRIAHNLLEQFPTEKDRNDWRYKDRLFSDLSYLVARGDGPAMHFVYNNLYLDDVGMSEWLIDSYKKAIRRVEFWSGKRKVREWFLNLIGKGLTDSIV